MIENTCSIGFGSDLDDETVASTSTRGGMGQYCFAGETTRKGQNSLIAMQLD
jgi:hypothetical protein